MKHLYQIKHKARVREKDRKSDGKRVGDLRDDSNRPFKRSDGYWYVWINDGRGGYDQILSRGEQDRLDRDGPDDYDRR